MKRAPRPQRRAVALAIAVVSTLLLLGAGYQAYAELRDRQRFTVPGRLVRISGRFVHLDCRGEGSPTVVFESGLGGSSLDWFALQPRVTTFTRSCSYDRPGMGWSQARRDSASAERRAWELALLLDIAAEEGPFVLVGASAGGLLVRAFADTFPERVAGLVLVDAWHDQQQTRLPAGLPDTEAPPAPALQLCRLLAPVGVVRLLGVMARSAAAFPFAAVRDARVAAMNRSRYCGALLRERRTLQPAAARTEPPRPLGDLPLVVMSRGPMPGPEGTPSGGAAKSATPTEAAWQTLQAELAALSSDSVQLVVEPSKNAVAAEQPGLLAAAIRRMVTRLRP